MNKQTENYIILKPIAERFNRISASITDEEIRTLIKQELRDQIKGVNFGFLIGEIVDEWTDSHRQVIEELLLESYKAKLKA